MPIGTFSTSLVVSFFSKFFFNDLLNKQIFQSIKILKSFLNNKFNE